MSAYPVSSVAAVLDRVGKTPSRTATCEYKYDGARVQVHLSLPDPNASSRPVRRIFSRNMEDVTERYSSLLDVLHRRIAARNAAAQGSPSVSSLIAEGEVVALDRATGTFRPFQVLQTKTTTEFCLFLFDLLAVDGANLLQVRVRLDLIALYQLLMILGAGLGQKPLRERRRLLRDLLEEEAGYVEFVKHADVGGTDAAVDAAGVRELLHKSVASGCEGLMIKALDGDESEYKAGRRSYSWMKLKHDYMTDESASSTAQKASAGTFLADTLDLVPIGAFHGKGRRAGVFGSFLMASYNSTTGKFEVRAMERVQRCRGRAAHWFLLVHRLSGRWARASRTRSCRKWRRAFRSTCCPRRTRCPSSSSATRLEAAVRTCGSRPQKSGRSKPRSSRSRRRTRAGLGRPSVLRAWRSASRASSGPDPTRSLCRRRKAAKWWSSSSSSSRPRAR